MCLASGRGQCHVLSVCAFRVHTRVDGWVFAESVFLWRRASSECNPISHTKLNNGVFAAWIFQSETCTVFCTCRPFATFAQRCSPNNKCSQIKLTKNYKLWCSSQHVHICRFHVNVMLLHSTPSLCLTHTQLSHIPTQASLLLFSCSQIIATVDLRKATAPFYFLCPSFCCFWRSAVLVTNVSWLQSDRFMVWVATEMPFPPSPPCHCNAAPMPGPEGCFLGFLQRCHYRRAWKSPLSWKYSWLKMGSLGFTLTEAALTYICRHNLTQTCLRMQARQSEHQSTHTVYKHEYKPENTHVLMFDDVGAPVITLHML